MHYHCYHYSDHHSNLELELGGIGSQVLLFYSHIDFHTNLGVNNSQLTTKLLLLFILPSYTSNQ